jgi:glutamine amidotransferase
MILIVDYGLGNLGSIQNMLKKVGENSIISSRKEDILKADKIILPGVGAFDTGINNLRKLDIVDSLNYKALTDKIPFLGICLGMQLMCNSSVEGSSKGLSWFDANLIRFDTKLGLKVPHMNWSYTKILKSSQLFYNMPEEMKFYHVHSYYIENKPDISILESDYHGFKFISALQRDNLFGVQFHPEKSHKYGMILLDNFANKI